MSRVHYVYMHVRKVSALLQGLCPSLHRLCSPSQSPPAVHIVHARVQNGYVRVHYVYVRVYKVSVHVGNARVRSQSSRARSQRRCAIHIAYVRVHNDYVSVRNVDVHGSKVHEQACNDFVLVRNV